MGLRRAHMLEVQKQRTSDTRNQVGSFVTSPGISKSAY
jgi:hypothetical protein